MAGRMTTQNHSVARLRKTSDRPLKRSFAAIFFSFACLQSPLAAQTLVITHVAVIDATGRPVRRDQTVVVEGDRIVTIGRSAAIPTGAQTVDGSGKYLIPGLWDMHAHTLNPGLFLRLYVANGVTGVRDMGSPMRGIDAWRKALAEGLPVPRVVAGVVIDGKPPIFPRDAIGVTTGDEARGAVRQAKKMGGDFIKIYSLFGREAYFAAVDEARKAGLPIAGHVPESITAAEASSAGQRSFEHLMGVFRSTSRDEVHLRAELDKHLASPSFAERLAAVGSDFDVHTAIDTFDATKAEALFKLLARNGTWQTPTLVALRAIGRFDDEQFVNDPRVKYMTPGQREAWRPQNDFRYRDQKPEDYAIMRKVYRKALEMTGRLHRAGVGILAGTDPPNPYCFPGFSIHDELALLVEAGLRPIEAIQAATRNPARYFGTESSMGTVERGKVADLVLLDANPLADITNTKKISAVVLGGKLLTRAQLDALLSEVEAAAKQ
jgi:imidazolonepropionase-like amidohydrolase